MATPVSFSGFNKIDFNMILDAVMIQERQPLDRLETQKKTLESQNTQLATLAGKLTTMRSAIDGLRDTESLALLTAPSSDTGVGVSTTSGTLQGSYRVVVTELARAQVRTSGATYASLTTVAATGGTLTLTPTTGDPVVITVTGSTTVQGLADAINAESDAPASASVVQTAPGTYQLMLIAKETGTANAFTVTDALTGGAALSLSETQTPLDAAFTVNGLSITSSGNSVDDVIPGVTLALKKKDAATAVTIDVQRDVAAAEAVIDKFITAYNDVVSFHKDQLTAAAAGKASIGRDPVLRSFRNSVADALRDDYASGGDYSALAKVGIGFDISGKLKLDTTVFAEAMAAAPGDVQALFSGADGTGGAFGALNTVVEGYTQAGGVVSDARTRISDQVSALTRRLDTMESQLEIRRQSLQREYIAADLAMTRLNAQSSSLSSLGGQYRLF